MGLARTLAVTLTGLTGHIVDVEAHATQGLPGFTLVGLPDAAVRESRERVRAALSTCGVTWGEQRLTVNLSPADLRKTGTGLDLALALAVLGARGRLGRSAAEVLGRTVYIGELGLDGSVHSVRGILPSVQAAVAAGVGEIVVGQEAAAEAELVPDARVSAISHIGQLVERYGGRLSEGVAAAVEQISEAGRDAPAALARDDEPPDLADVVGQTEARQALEVAAAGGHHLIMVGPPGTGKTMLAERLPSILPPLEQSDAVTVTSIHSVAGTFNPAHGLITRPPLRAPHHTATRAAVVGGGSGLPRPGTSPWPTVACCSSTRPPSSVPGSWTVCVSPWSPGRSPLTVWEDGPATRPPSSSFWQPTPARAARPVAGDWIAPARPCSGGATSRGCPDRCWTGWTSRSRWQRSVPRISPARRAASPALWWRSGCCGPGVPRSADWRVLPGGSMPRCQAPSSGAPTAD